MPTPVEPTGEIGRREGRALARFVGLPAVSEDCGTLGRHYESELYYRLLQSSMGDTLRQLGRRDSRSRKIKVAAGWLVANAEKPFVIADLVASAGMSLTAFHRHLKACARRACSRQSGFSHMVALAYRGSPMPLAMSARRS